jgi:hypothetical protein
MRSRHFSFTARVFKYNQMVFQQFIVQNLISCIHWFKMPIPAEIIAWQHFRFFAINACTFDQINASIDQHAAPLAIYTIRGLFSGFQSPRISREYIPSMQRALPVPKAARSQCRPLCRHIHAICYATRFKALSKRLSGGHNK